MMINNIMWVVYEPQRFNFSMMCIYMLYNNVTVTRRDYHKKFFTVIAHSFRAS